MTIDKNYFLSRLANGESIDTIGEEVAAMMNAAVAEHEAQEEAKRVKAAEADKQAAKRELVEEMCEIMYELAILEGFDPEDMEVTDQMVDQIMESMTASFALARKLEKLFAEETPAKRVIKSDDQILAEFAKMFS